MVHTNSQDPYIQIYIALLRDVQTRHSEVFKAKELRLTIQKVLNRCSSEGLSFLTKTLPRLGKLLDRGLTGDCKFDCTKLAFERRSPSSKLPKFLGELFELVFSSDGSILQTPCVECIKDLRQLLFIFYKLELAYTDSQEQRVLSSFEKTETELGSWNAMFSAMRKHINANVYHSSLFTDDMLHIARLTKVILSDLFSKFDPRDICPRHGPGVVSTRERLEGKFVFRQISPRLAAYYPIDEYFYASLGHVCDEVSRLNSTDLCESSARVILVPKDSRGPRLISCEPLAFQWIQQGLGRAIVQLVENHPLTRFNIHFTDQSPNRCGAAFGSITGEYATLDLKDASDRVCVELVRLLFPEHISEFLLAARSESTTLPDGRVLKLNKYAPMGSALCFPVLSLVCWALLHAGLSDARSIPGRKGVREISHTDTYDNGILVYGDDVIVRAAQAANAIQLLESFGLLVNRDKSCCTGFFRESCGLDAYLGVDVTPVRLRTLWRYDRRPDVYTSYLAFANLMWERDNYNAYESIVRLLFEVYEEIPESPDPKKSGFPSLYYVPLEHRPTKYRTNFFLQKREVRVWDLKSPRVTRTSSGWTKLLRYFTEGTGQSPYEPWDSVKTDTKQMQDAGPCFKEPFRVSEYTKRSTSLLVKCWR
jgi:hypothetical protein